MAKKTLAVHDGKFHADDVFAAAALLLLEPTLRIIRTRDRKRIASADFAADVGEEYAPERNRFDHHQLRGAGKRESGIPYASFGLVWRKFGAVLAGPRAAAILDESLVAPIDARDNGVPLCSPVVGGYYPYGISDAVRAFTPTWEEETALGRRFKQAVAVAKKILEREIIHAHSRADGEERVRAAYRKAADKRLVVLDRDYSWKETLARFPEPLYVVLPQDDRWNLYCVRDNPKAFANRKNLPASWSGLRDKALQQAAGVADAIFCHRNRFVAAAMSRAGALALAQKALSS